MTDKAQKTKPFSGLTKFRKEWIEPFVIALFLFIIIQFLVVQQFKIPSGSMEDTLLVGDRLIAVKFIYGIKIPFLNRFAVRFRDPKPGEIIVFKFPQDTSKPFIKRCIAVGGQKVEIRNKDVYVDDKLQLFPEHAKFIYQNPHPRFDNYGPSIIPEGHMFVMGDNRQNSNDSRFWGYVPYDNISGKAAIILWSWNHEVPLYDIIHGVRWRRLFKIIR